MLYRTYMKACRMVIVPILALIGTTKNLPDWLALALLAIPVFTLAFKLPTVTMAFGSVLAIAFASVVIDMQRVAARAEQRQG